MLTTYSASEYVVAQHVSWNDLSCRIASAVLIQDEIGDCVEVHAVTAHGDYHWVVWLQDGELYGEA